MKTYFENVPTVSQVDFADIAEKFSEETSTEQVGLLRELFQALRYKCGDDYKFQSQLCYIAREINLRNYKQLKETIETLNEFLNEDKNDN